MTTEGVAETRIYSGETWTDARGQATVLLPEHVDSLPSPFEYELEPDDPCVHARRRAGASRSPLHDRDRQATREGELARARKTDRPISEPPTTAKRGAPMNEHRTRHEIDEAAAKSRLQIPAGQSTSKEET